MYDDNEEVLEDGEGELMDDELDTPPPGGVEDDFGLEDPDDKYH